LDDPGLDLAVCAYLISNNEDTSVSEELCFAGEISLRGEIRAVSRIENRITEAEKLGFKKMRVWGLEGGHLNSEN